MIKAIVCDLDGTLLSADHRISDFTKEVVGEIKSRGIEILIATGRHHLDAISFQRVLGLDTCLVSSNGAKVHDENNCEIVSDNISPTIAEPILKLEVDPSIRSNIYNNDIWYANKTIESLKSFYIESGFFPIVQPMKELVGKEVTKFFFISETEDTFRLNNLEKELARQFGHLIDLTFSLPTCLEILKKGVSKGAAVEKVLKNKGIRMDETIAFGDGLNDLEMLSMVKTGYIMGNGSPRLKHSLPNNPIIGNNNEDGLAKKLQELFF